MLMNNDNKIRIVEYLLCLVFKAIYLTPQNSAQQILYLSFKDDELGKTGKAIERLSYLVVGFGWDADLTAKSVFSFVANKLQHYLFQI
jgi:hypothetical protein